MQLSKKETYRNKKVSLGVTILSFVVMLVFFIFTNVITAHPIVIGSSNFVASPEISLSMDGGSSESSGSLQEQVSVGSYPQKSSAAKIQTADAQIHSESGISNLITRYKTAKFVNAPADEIKITEPGSLEGKDKTGLRPGPQTVSSSMLFSLGGRSIIGRPSTHSSTQEQGTVVVDITVDKNGKVIDANPNGRGTTTNNPALKSDAAKIAFGTKFNADQKFEEQRGTITIIFSFD